MSDVVQEEETEVDSHTMVKSGSEGAGTMRATSTMSDGAQTMIEHGSTMLESDLGTMVINSDDDEEEEEDQRSMRSEHQKNNNWEVFRRLLMVPPGLTHVVLSHRTRHPSATHASIVHGLF